MLAWRAGFCPHPACSTCPRMTSLICSPFTPVRLSRSAITAAPSSDAGVLARAPPNFPTAVRAAATITMSFMTSVLVGSGRSPARDDDVRGSDLAQDVSTRSRLDDLMDLVPRGFRGGHLALGLGLCGQPGRPGGPPAAGVLLGLILPLTGLAWQDRSTCSGPAFLGGCGGRWQRPVAALALLRRVDHPGNVARSPEHEGGVTLEQAGGGIGAVPGHDVIFARSVDKGGHVQS